MVTSQGWEGEWAHPLHGRRSEVHCGYGPFMITPVNSNNLTAAICASTLKGLKDQEAALTDKTDVLSQHLSLCNC